MFRRLLRYFAFHLYREEDQRGVGKNQLNTGQGTPNRSVRDNALTIPQVLVQLTPRWLARSGRRIVPRRRRLGIPTPLPSLGFFPQSVLLGLTIFVVMRRHPVVLRVGVVRHTRVLAVLIRPVVSIRTGHRRCVYLLGLFDRVSTGGCGVLFSVVVAVVVGLRVRRIVVVVVITRLVVMVRQTFVGVVLRMLFPRRHDPPEQRRRTDLDQLHGSAFML